MKAYIQLLRPKHGVKNLLVLFPLVFSGRLWEGELLARSLWAALAFWGAAGAVYIFNDVRDRERDRLHPVKCRRPVDIDSSDPERSSGIGHVRKPLCRHQCYSSGTRTDIQQIPVGSIQSHQSTEEHPVGIHFHGRTLIFHSETFESEFTHTGGSYNGYFRDPDITMSSLSINSPSFI